VEKIRCERMAIRECVPILKSQRSALADLLEGGGTVLTRTIEALDRVNRVLSDQNVKTFSAALSDTQAVTAELRERKAILADAQKAIQDIDAASQQVTALTQSGRQIVDTDGRRGVKNIADAAQEAKETAHDARVLMAKLQGPASEFATTGLPQITAAVIQLQSATEALERLVNEIQRSPTGALGKGAADEIKVKP
jgi:phospholipid/cholesterol/gamma-HCH transport system substrate-binding protein